MYHHILILVISRPVMGSENTHDGMHQTKTTKLSLILWQVNQVGWLVG